MRAAFFVAILCALLCVFGVRSQNTPPAPDPTTGAAPYELIPEGGEYAWYSANFSNKIASLTSSGTLTVHSAADFTVINVNGNPANVYGTVASVSVSNGAASVNIPLSAAPSGTRRFRIEGYVQTASTAGKMTYTLNNDTASNYYVSNVVFNSAGWSLGDVAGAAGSGNQGSGDITNNLYMYNSYYVIPFSCDILLPLSTTYYKQITCRSYADGSSYTGWKETWYTSTSAITSMQIQLTSGTFTLGSVEAYAFQYLGSS